MVTPIYEILRLARPKCPQCKEFLKGHNSISNPYSCACGIWRRNYKSTSVNEYFIEKKDNK